MMPACQWTPWTCLPVPVRCSAAFRTVPSLDAMAWMPAIPNHSGPFPAATSYRPSSFHHPMPTQQPHLPAPSRTGLSCLRPMPSQVQFTPFLVSLPHQGEILRLQSPHGTSYGGTRRAGSTATGTGRTLSGQDLQNSPGHRGMVDADPWFGARTPPSGSCRAPSGLCSDPAWLVRDQARRMPPPTIPPMLTFNPLTHGCISMGHLATRVGSQCNRVLGRLYTESLRNNPRLITKGGVILLKTASTLQPTPLPPPGAPWLQWP